MTFEQIYPHVYAQVCAQAYRYHLETGVHIEYRELARMAAHMTTAALKEAANHEPI